MISDSKYIDQIYHFKGAWNIHSFCGLKIIDYKDKPIVIAKELYDSIQVAPSPAGLTS